MLEQPFVVAAESGDQIGDDAEIDAGAIFRHILLANRNTAYTYYKKFSDQIHTINETNFFEEIKSRIKQLITSYDHLLLESYSILDSLNSQINEHQGEIIPQHLQSQKISVIREIRNILNEKVSLELKIPLDDSLEAIVDKVILKHEKSGKNS